MADNIVKDAEAVVSDVAKAVTGAEGAVASKAKKFKEEVVADAKKVEAVALAEFNWFKLNWQGLIAGVIFGAFVTSLLFLVK